jgi:hypothetical protein
MKTSTKAKPRPKKDKPPPPPPFLSDPRREWLIGIIHAYGVSNVDFGRMVGIDPSTFNMLSTGRRRITDRTVYRIVRKLGVPTPTGVPPPPSLVPQHTNADVQALQRQFSELSGKLEKVQILLAEAKKAAKKNRK